MPKKITPQGGGFLSTPSARRATAVLRGQGNDHRISIHALREEGDGAALREPPPQAISIHALREEGDTSSSIKFTLIFYFYPRPPRGGRP